MTENAEPKTETTEREPNAELKDAIRNGAYGHTPKAQTPKVQAPKVQAPAPKVQAPNVPSLPLPAVVGPQVVYSPTSKKQRIQGDCYYAPLATEEDKGMVTLTLLCGIAEALGSSRSYACNLTGGDGGRKPPYSEEFRVHSQGHGHNATKKVSAGAVRIMYKLITKKDMPKGTTIATLTALAKEKKFNVGKKA